MTEMDWRPIFNDGKFQQKRIDRMKKIDGMSPELRNLVHQYGFHVVNTFMAVGIHEPRNIKHLVETVLDEFSPTRGTSSNQGIRAKDGM